MKIQGYNVKVVDLDTILGLYIGSDTKKLSEAKYCGEFDPKLGKIVAVSPKKIIKKFQGKTLVLQEFCPESGYSSKTIYVYLGQGRDTDTSELFSQVVKALTYINGKKIREVAKQYWDIITPKEKEISGAKINMKNRSLEWQLAELISNISKQAIKITDKLLKDIIIMRGKK